MYQSTLILVLFRFFLIAFVIGTVLLIVRSIKSYQALATVDHSLSLGETQSRAAMGGQPTKFRIILKSSVAFLLWLIFSLYIVALDFTSSVGDRIGAEPVVEANTRTLGIIGAHLLWFLAGLLLIYWVGKRPVAVRLR